MSIHINNVGYDKAVKDLFKRIDIFNFAIGVILPLLHFILENDKSKGINKIIDEGVKFIYFCTKQNQLALTEEEVVEEYRLLFFYGEEPIAIQREVGKNGNWQANSCITGFSKEVDYNIIDEDLLNKINDLGLYIKTPFMSTDVYKTKEGVWGIFEFQMEFGFKDVPPTKLCKKMNNSIKNLYNKLK